MLKSLQLENFTGFPKADLSFGKNLNVIIGENGTGKSHLLKAAYVALAVSAEAAKDAPPEGPSKARLQTALADKLIGVFKPDALRRLVRRKVGRDKCRLRFTFSDARWDLDFGFSTLAESQVSLHTAPTACVDQRPVYLPTRELMSLVPKFVPLYETYSLPFEQTWRDTCLLLGLEAKPGQRRAEVKALLPPLEAAMGGVVQSDPTGRFHLKLPSGKMEMFLVAEGLRKLATVAQLVANGVLKNQGYLFWDEPEANLNPKMVKTIAQTILQLAANGIQVFIATHSLFLLRELHIGQQGEFKSLDTHCFGLHLSEDEEFRVEQGPTMDDVGDITSLDEELQQSQRYMDTEYKAQGSGNQTKH